MRRIKVDFSKRTERDDVPLPKNEKFELNEKLELFDEDMQVKGRVLKKAGKWVARVDWHSVKLAGTSSPPPPDVQEFITKNPFSIRKPWPM